MELIPKTTYLSAILLAATIFTGCATSKNDSPEPSATNKNFAFEYLPQIDKLPSKVSNFVLPDGRFEDGILTQDGNYLLAGKIRRIENTYVGEYPGTLINPFVIKINNDGQTLWKIAVDSVRHAPLAIREVTDYFVLLSEKSKITKIDKNGEVLKTINLDFPAQSLEVSENEFIFSSLREKTLFVIRTGQDGKILNELEIKDDRVSFSEQIKFDSAGNFYAYGFGIDQNISSAPSVIYLFKYSKDGSRLWEKEYPLSNGYRGYVKRQNISISDNHIGIVTHKEIMVIDFSGELKYKYPVSENEPEFSNGKLLQDQKMLFLQYNYNPNQLIVKTVTPFKEINDLTHHLFSEDSTERKRSEVKIITPVIINNGQNLILAGAISAGRRDAAYIRKILLKEPSECPNIEVTDSVNVLSFSEKQKVFKNQEWIEDSITIKNKGGSIQFLSGGRELEHQNIKLNTDQDSFSIYPGEERTIVFKYNKNATNISFYFHGVICPTENLRFRLY